MSKLFEYFGIKFPRGEYLFREGDPADDLYMIHKGKVEITKKSGNVTRTLKVLSEGEFVGEMAVIDSMPRSANAVCKEDCHLIKMDRKSFETSVRENHQFAISVIQFLTRRLRDTNDEVLNLAKENLGNQILIDLLNEYLRSGKKDKDGKWYLLKLETLIDKYNAKYQLKSERILAIIDDFTSGGLIHYKKDRAGDIWVAYAAVI